MLGRISLWAAGAVVAGLLLPSQAMAQYDAHTRADLNLRVGPGTQYGVIDVIPAGYPVDVLGCLDAYEWCDIEWDGLRGWVSARYLVQPGTTVYLPQYAPRIGVPIITFSFGTYHDRYYRDRPWYRERHGRWTGKDWRDRDGDRKHGDSSRDRVQVEQGQEAVRQRDMDQLQQQEPEAQPQQRKPEAQPLQQRKAQPQQQQKAQPQQQQKAQPQQQGDRPERGQRVQRQGNGGPPEKLKKKRRQ